MESTPWRQHMNDLESKGLRKVLKALLGTEDFELELIPVLGLERRYEVTTATGKVYLSVLAFRESCADKIDRIRTWCEKEGEQVQIMASKDCEPALGGRPYILADKPV